MNDALSLLVIDDDELDRKSIIRTLTQSSADLCIAQAGTALEGIHLASIKQYDAILLDYALPDQDGLEVLRTLRAENSHGVAVIMLSRYDDEAIAEQCLDAGAQDFLLKDEVTSRSLNRALRQAKHRFSLTEALRISNEQLRTLSERDPLTGLANRRGFENALKSALHRAEYGQTKLAVLLIDLDDFKGVNDTLGHDAGDQLLIEISDRLKATVRDGDSLCRLGGDEFVVLAKYLDCEEQAALLGERILSVFRHPILINSVELVISASIGIAVLGECAHDSPDLLKHADVAMYRAKQEGRNQYRFYSERLHVVVEHRARIKRDLHHAVERGEMRVYYQAQISAEDGSLGGMEALVRWAHPTLGILTPFDFLSVAEEAGFIADIGNWVLSDACKTFAGWRHRFPLQCNDLSIAVNLSASQIKEAGLLRLVQNVLKENGIAPRHLELEITENAFISETIDAIVGLSRLGLEGVKLALDDFGTGYSSLQHLKMFPINLLKIDKVFISSIGKSDIDERLLIALIRFAKLLDLKVVAEGVENEAQARFCTQHGCDLLQGYYYSRPIPADKFEESFFRQIEE